MCLYGCAHPGPTADVHRLSFAVKAQCVFTFIYTKSCVLLVLSWRQQHAVQCCKLLSVKARNYSTCAASHYRCPALLTHTHTHHWDMTTPHHPRSALRGQHSASSACSAQLTLSYNFVEKRLEKIQVDQDEGEEQRSISTWDRK